MASDVKRAYVLSFVEERVRLNVASAIQDRIGRHAHIDMATAKVANAIGAVPYLKQAQIADFFDRYLKKMRDLGFHWTAHEEHGKLLGDLEDVGGLQNCPESLLSEYLTWLVLAYIGERGGYGMGVNRPVFFSNTAAPIIRRLLKDAPPRVRKALQHIEDAGYTALYVGHIYEKANLLNILLMFTVAGANQRPRSDW